MTMRLFRASVLLVASSSLVLAQPPSPPRLGSNAPNPGYQEVPDWPAQLMNAAGAPAPWNFIQVSGVAIDSHGHILVLHRGAHPLLEFEINGKLVRPWDNIVFSEGKVAAIAPSYRVAGHSAYSAAYGPAGCDSCGAHSVRVDPEHNV